LSVPTWVIDAFARDPLEKDYVTALTIQTRNCICEAGTLNETTVTGLPGNIWLF
jgi:hypothetical protein